MILHDHQKRALKDCLTILRGSSVCYLAGEVRSGKTLVALHAADKCGKAALFITKKMAVPGIEKQIKAAGLSCSFTVINFESLHKLPSRLWPFIIIDEAHTLGGFPKPPKRAQVIRALSAGSRVLLLSGTPSPESWSQLYHQLWAARFPHWERYRNFYAWAKDFVQVKKMYFSGVPVNDYSDADRERITAETRPFFVSLTQAEAGFQGKVLEKVHRVELPEAIHEALEAVIATGVYLPYGLVAGSAAQRMAFVHQICSGTVIPSDLGVNEKAVSEPETGVGIRIGGVKKAVSGLNLTVSGNVRKKPCGGVNEKAVSEVFTGKQKAVSEGFSEGASVKKGLFIGQGRFKRLGGISAIRPYLDGIEGENEKAVFNAETAYSLNHPRRPFLGEKPESEAFMNGSKGITLDLSKVSYLRKTFKGKRLAVFYCYVQEGLELRKAFPNHTSDPEVFKKDRSKTFICQIKAGQEGTDLSCAQAIVFFNISYSAASYFQGRARGLVREGGDVCIHWLFSDFGFEEKIYNLIQNEKKRFTTSHFRKEYSVKNNRKAPL